MASKVTSNERRSSLNWLPVAFGILGVWLSASLTLDLLVMPSLAGSGMMDRAAFATVGYGLFGTFNRLELIFAAAVLSSVLALRFHGDRAAVRSGLRRLLLAGGLVLLAATSTYLLTPTMGALGASVEWLEAPAPAMATMHAAYWGLETCKFVLGIALLAGFYRDSELVDADTAF